MAKKIFKKNTKKIKPSNIINDVNEYNMLRQRKKVMDKRMKELSDRIKKFAMNNGSKDSKGNMYCTDDDNFIYGAIAKKSIKLNEEKAEQFLTEKGLYDKCVKTIEKIDDDKLKVLVEHEEISLDELESIMDIKVSYTLDVKEKKQEEDMPEIQPTKLVK